MYDFKKMDIHSIKERIKGLKNRLEEDKKRINFKVDAMFDDTNNQYENLLKKKETIELNKKEV